jgi:penicillin-binding protein 1A
MKKKILGAGVGAAALCLLAVALWLVYILNALPDISKLKHYRPPAAAEVFDRSGRLLTQYHDRKLRFWVPVSDVPDHVVWAVVIAEDDTFFAHEGVNYKATWDAFVHDVKKGRLARGGSTITQQMIKNVMLSREKTINRKVREYFLARKAEDLLTKRQILEIYLNEVEWGDKIYGIEAASRYYFDKHVTELTIGEAALLAGMLPNPRYFNPFMRIEKARDRQERVLSNMLQAKVIPEEAFTSALSSPVGLRQESSVRFDFSSLAGNGARPCYQRVLEEAFLAAYGEHGLYRQGMKIRTVLDKDLQDTVRSWEESTGSAGPGIPDSITIAKEGSEIRAISCSSNEDAVRSWISPPGVPTSEIILETVPPRVLSASDFVAAPAAVVSSTHP